MKNFNVFKGMLLFEVMKFTFTSKNCKPMVLAIYQNCNIMNL